MQDNQETGGKEETLIDDKDMDDTQPSDTTTGQNTTGRIRRSSDTEVAMEGYLLGLN